MNNKILVTGGAGYIGSHICIELHQAGCNVALHNNSPNINIEAVNYTYKTICNCD